LAFGELYLSTKNYSESLVWLRAAAETPTEAVDLRDQKNVMSRLAHVYKELGDFERSVKFFKQAETLEQQLELEKQRALRKLTEVESQYINKQAKQIGLHIPDITTVLTSSPLPSAAPNKPSLLLTNVYVKTLGAFHVTIDNRAIQKADWQRKKARDVFKVLLINYQKSVTLDQLIDLVWSDAPPSESAVVSIVSYIRKVLEPTLEAYQPSRFVEKQGRAYLLDFGEGAMIDFIEFKSLVSDARTLDLPKAVPLYERAVKLYGGDFLNEDAYESWATFERESLQDTYITVQKKLMTHYAAQSQTDAAIAAAKTILGIDRTDTESYETLFTLYAATSDRAAAQKLSAVCTDAFKQELNAKPPEKLRRFLLP
jgi:DNA-binding SARP family transcriptional activator